MSLAFAEHDVAVWQGDALEQLTLMPAGSVQCALSSPPYFGLRDYGIGQAPLEFEPAPVAVEPCVVQDGFDLGDGWPA